MFSGVRGKAGCQPGLAAFVLKLNAIGISGRSMCPKCPFLGSGMRLASFVEAGGCLSIRGVHTPCGALFCNACKRR